MGLFLFIVAVVILLLLIPARSKGAAGEHKVNRKIKNLVKNNNQFHVFNDLTLATPDGTTQIDHIILS
jgi:restriction system protein